MRDALVAATTDPDVLADLAKGKLRAKIPALRQALQGRFEAHHALVIGAILAHWTSSTSRSTGSLTRSRPNWALPGPAAWNSPSTMTGVARARRGHGR
jgi:hypothetical protein